MIGIDLPNKILKPTDKMKVRAVHDGEHVYFLLQWVDTTHSMKHKPFKWSEIRERYVVDHELEDVAFIALELEGRFNVNMVAGVDAVWDMWHWKAARTNPVGYAMDKIHIYSREQPKGKAEKVRLLDGKMGYIQRPEDEGTSCTRKQKAPETKDKEYADQYVPQKPSGSAADVEAKGAWKDDVWTVEFKRKLDTGHKDDRKIEIGASIGVSFGVLRDSEDDDHYVSMPYTLKLTD